MSKILFIDAEQDSNTESLIEKCKEPKVWTNHAFQDVIQKIIL